MRWFATCLKCECNVSVSEGFVVLCRSKPSLLSPSKQRPCRPQVSSSSAVVFTALRVSQLHFYISIVLAVSCSYSVFAGGQISAVPIQIYMVRTQNLSDVSVSACVSLHVYISVLMNCLCCLYSRFLMMRVNFLLLSETSLSKHSQLWSPTLTGLMGFTKL